MENFKDGEEDEKEELEEVGARLFATNAENQATLHVTLRIQHTFSVSIVVNLIML